MEFFRFWWRCVQRATSGALGRAEVVSFLLLIALGAYAYFKPPGQPSSDVLLWAIPLAALILFFLAGLVYAPYAIYRDLLREVASRPDLYLLVSVDNGGDQEVESNGVVLVTREQPDVVFMIENRSPRSAEDVTLVISADRRIQQVPEPFQEEVNRIHRGTVRLGLHQLRLPVLGDYVVGYAIYYEGGPKRGRFILRREQ